MHSVGFNPFSRIQFLAFLVSLAYKNLKWVQNDNTWKDVCKGFFFFEMGNIGGQHLFFPHLSFFFSSLKTGWCLDLQQTCCDHKLNFMRYTKDGREKRKKAIYWKRYWAAEPTTAIYLQTSCMRKINPISVPISLYILGFLLLSGRNS